MKLVIDRSTWLRGEEDAGLLLREADGRRCCLGFLGVSCGIDDDAMASIGCPREVASTEWPAWLVTSEETEDEYGDAELRRHDSATADRLMAINDDGDLSEPEREKRLAAIFAKHDVEVEFVDGPVSS